MTQTPSAPPSGLRAAIGAAGVALLSTACCWVPLLLIVAGAGASSVAMVSALEVARWPLVVLASGLLMWAHWRTYGHKLSAAKANASASADACCADDAGCARAGKRPRRALHHLMLWFATAKVGLLAVYPHALLSLITAPAPAEATADAAGAPDTYTVSGPSLCAGCIPQLEAALLRVEGVARVRVTLASAQVEVWPRAGEAPASPEAVIAAASALNLTLTPRR